MQNKLKIITINECFIFNLVNRDEFLNSIFLGKITKSSKMIGRINRSRGRTKVLKPFNELVVHDNFVFAFSYLCNRVDSNI